MFGFKTTLRQIQRRQDARQYHPKMMLKVMIYSFSQKTYSSRQIAKSLRENINFMWIAGGNKPDFRTINRFRLDMKDVIEDVFYEVVKLLIEKNT